MTTRLPDRRSEIDSAKKTGALKENGYMAKLSFWLSAAEEMTLERVVFKHPLLQFEQKAVRGKTSGALHNYGTFQWTSAVQALLLLALKHSLYGQGDNTAAEQQALLQGEDGTPASSLDYAIGKLPLWLVDMFGVDSHGRAVVKRLVRRTNPERKRPGPVLIAINSNTLRCSEIEFFLNEKPITSPDDLTAIAKTIESQWKNRAEFWAKKASGARADQANLLSQGELDMKEAA